MKSDVEIRIASPLDAEEIASVIREAFAPLKELYTPEGFAATTPDAQTIRERFREKGAIWTAIENGKIVGTVSVVAEEDKRLYIRSMAVLPASQVAGLGRKLLETVEKYARENGFEILYLYTLPFLSDAFRLYKQNGFERGEDTAPEDYFGMAGWTMEKKLN